MPDPLDQLRKLGDLHERGILTDEEFQAKKQVLLAQVGNAAGTGEAPSPARATAAAVPTTTVPEVEAAFAAVLTLDREVTEEQATVDKMLAEQMTARKELRLVTSRLQLRTVADRFPLGRYGALIIATAAAAALGAMLGIGIRVGNFATAWLTLISAAAGALGTTWVVFWRSDAELVELQADLSRRVSNLVKSLDSVLADLAEQQTELAAARERHESLLTALQSRRTHLLESPWRSMRGLAFEQFVCDVFDELGCETQLTKATGDQGVDLIVRTGPLCIAVQIKGYADSVGNQAVQQAHAGMTYYGCNRSMVITNSVFTTSAVELAARLNCRLIDGSQIPQLICGKIDLQ